MLTLERVLQIVSRTLILLVFLLSSDSGELIVHQAGAEAPGDGVQGEHGGDGDDQAGLISEELFYLLGKYRDLD